MLKKEKLYRFSLNEFTSFAVSKWVRTAVVCMRKMAGAQGQQYESLLLSCMLKFLAVMQCQKIVIIFPNVIGYSQMVFSDTIYNIKKNNNKMS